VRYWTLPLAQFGILAVAHVALFQANPALAQQNAPTAAPAPALQAGKRVFLPEELRSPGPGSALDLVGRVPGFEINDGDEVRGFGGAAGNVLIDGARPTSKNETVSVILSRIPAASVAQVELLEGAMAGALAPGQSRIVNVVRKTDAAAGGNWIATASGLSSGLILPKLEASYSTKLGAMNWTFGMKSAYANKQTYQGFEGFIDPQGQFLEFGPNDDRRRTRFGRASVAMDAQWGAYKVTANASTYQESTRRQWVHVATRLGAPTPYRVDEGREGADETRYELGGDIERSLLGWTSKLALLAKQTEIDSGSYAGFNDIGAQPSFDRFNANDFAQERVARATFKRAFGNHQRETGGEFAFNSLDYRGLFAQSEVASLKRGQGEASRTQVEEDRREAFISDAWTISPKFTLEGTFTGEWSNIRQAGEDAKERSFFYPKPRLKAVWKPNAAMTYRAEIDRSVGQLDFNAFADSASVGDGTANSGNPDLRPERTLDYRLAGEYRWGGRGVFSATAIKSDIEDHLTLIPIGQNDVVLGNVPDAQSWGYDLNWTLPLEKWVKGLEFSGTYQWRKTEVVDPLTRTKRPLSGDAGKKIDVNVRYEVPRHKLKVGAWYYHGDHNRDFRPDQTFEWGASQYWGAWVETKAIKGLTIELGVEDINGNKFDRLRTSFDPDRRSGVIASQQYRERRLDGVWYIQVSGAI
jgi:hypothetical protein